MCRVSAIVAVAIPAALALQPVIVRAGQLPAPVCPESTVTMYADADAWISDMEMSMNKGTDGILRVEPGTSANLTMGGSGRNRILVRFTLPAAVANGCVVQSARLRLYAPSASEGERADALQLASSWSEGQVTWGNQPATIDPPATAWARQGYMQWNVTSHVQSMLAGGNYGFLIRDYAEGGGGAGHAFHSREKGDNPPQLVIHFAAPSIEDPSLPPDEPIPVQVSCGQVVLRSTFVLNSLTDCPGDGLVIGAARIIVDLGGQTIDGVGLGAGIVNDGHPAVTIRNGTVQQFDYGVELLSETMFNTVQGLTLQQNQIAGIHLFDAGRENAGNVVIGNAVAENGLGIALVSGTTATWVSENALTLNGGAAVHLVDAHFNVISGNTASDGGDLGIGLKRATGNRLAGNRVSANSDGGIELRESANDNFLELNEISRSGDHGILVDSSDRNVLISNAAHEMSDSGITLTDAHGGVVRRNDARFNAGGIQVDGSSGILIEANNVSRNTGIGIELGAGCAGNSLVGNTASENGGQGLYVGSDVVDGAGNLLQGNTAIGNHSDGIVAAKAGQTLVENIGSNNGAWGIYAAPGNVDGGGNRARDNGERAGCYGIVCSAGPDVTAPETTIVAQPLTIDTRTTATFHFAGIDQVTPAASLAFECRLDGAAYAACASPVGYVDLAPGTHSFDVRAIDAAGNVDQTPASYAWTIAAPLPPPLPPPPPPPSPPDDCDRPVLLTAIGDAWIDQNSASTNKGDDSIVKVMAKSGDNLRTLIRFALPPVPAGCVVQSATLRVYSSSSKTGRTLHALRIAEPWGERLVTWRNQPATAGTPAAAAAGFGWREWNVAAQVQEMYDAAAAHGFLIRDAAESRGDAEQQFHSREKGEAPALLIQFSRPLLQ